MVPKSDMKANQVNGLYPIIRRVRRPLLPVEDLAVGRPADAKPKALASPGPGGVGAGEKRAESERNHEKNDSEKTGEAAKSEGSVGVADAAAAKEPLPQ